MEYSIALKQKHTEAISANFIKFSIQFFLFCYNNPKIKKTNIKWTVWVRQVNNYAKILIAINFNDLQHKL